MTIFIHIRALQHSIMPCNFIFIHILLATGRTAPSQSQSQLQRTPPPLDVLYQNDHIAVIAKPPICPCHRLEIRKDRKRRTVKDNDKDAVIPVLQRAVATFPQKDSVRLVHRLDSPTSGCLLLAFSPEATKEASKALANGEKTYFALCRGNGESLRRRGIFRAEGDITDSRGRIKSGALTEFECLYGTDGPPRRCCLVRCKPRTGFYHQIRQHLGRENHPIVGENRHHPDRKENRFWRDELGLLPQSRICLHCHRILLENTEGNFQFLPRDGLDVTCPLPKDMKSLIELTDFSGEAMKLLG